MAHVRLFAGAADAAGFDQCDLDAASLAQLREALLERGGPQLARVLPQCSMLVEGVATVGDSALAPDARVDVLPPFAGG